EIKRIKNVQITPRKEVIEFLDSLDSSELKKTISLYELIKRPELDYFKLEPLDVDRANISYDVKEQVNIVSKYEGYINKQLEQVEQYKKFESKLIPQEIDYDDVKGLRIEAIQKLSKIRPISIGQASRISGVSPADISVLLIYLEREYREKVIK
ncbi:tRNA uridine-5-carboxymethylaminomethyl(34) synthesis enzyme MnmG, partial [Clostridiaceae bacterium UIB06]|nr:tRNA uridine-5-carboxymethylaminomethyl(34) synthesis enzyme MnmG [Clostridiaceae bacterium UIB06]